MTNRRRFIIDMVEKWKKDYPEEVKEWEKLMKWRRNKVKDDKHGKIQGSTEMRHAVSFPEKVINPIKYVLNGVEEKKFLEEEGEMKWFIKKFPEFLISKSY